MYPFPKYLLNKRIYTFLQFMTVLSDSSKSEFYNQGSIHYTRKINMCHSSKFLTRKNKSYCYRANMTTNTQRKQYKDTTSVTGTGNIYIQSCCCQYSILCFFIFVSVLIFLYASFVEMLLSVSKCRCMQVQQFRGFYISGICAKLL